MKRDLRSSFLTILSAAFVVLACGCQTLQPPAISTDSLEIYGGGGGDGS